MKEDQKCKKKYFWGVFLSWPPFSRKCPFYTLKTSSTSFFGHLKMVTFGNGMEFRKLFDILVHPRNQVDPILGQDLRVPVLDGWMIQGTQKLLIL